MKSDIKDINMLNYSGTTMMNQSWMIICGGI